MRPFWVTDTTNVPVLGSRTRYIASLQVYGLIYATKRKRQLSDMKDKNLNLLDMFPEELEKALESLGEKKFRAKQVFSWLHKGADFDEMTNIPKALRETLQSEFALGGSAIVKRRESRDGTVKYLYELGDGERVEGVRMKYKHGVSLCISTQAGCDMGCAFCASAIGGCARNLLPGEMLGEVLSAQRDCGERISNVVLMGSGEPMLNLENVLKFLRLLSHPEGLNISLRSVSVSTCGLPEGIALLADSGLPVTLAISLHAPNDAIRQALMPVAKRIPVDDVIKAARGYVKTTGRRVIFEYALIGGVNDEPEHARELAGRLRGIQCHVNLIPLNALAESKFTGSGPERTAEFLKTLTDLHISATLRRSLGADIDGACGQLRRVYNGVQV